MALADFGELDVFRYPHDPLLTRVWQLRDSLTAYDASYVALAEALDAPLLTSDTRLGRATGHAATVEIIGSE
jgi:predicted nucleic acid-binding protein